MKIVFNDSQKLNEIVFANRNKNYGAYAIRAAYNSTIFKSLTIVTSTVFLFMVGVYTFTRLAKEKINVYVGTNDTTVVVPFNSKPDDPTPPQPEKKVNTFIAPKANAMSTIISDTAEVNNNPINTDIENNGTTNGDPNASNGNSMTGPVGDPVGNTNPETPEPPTAFPAENAEFEGGVSALMNFIKQNTVYPELAREIGREGTVYITFIIDENGAVESSKILKGIGAGCDEEATRVINKIPKFKKPGRNEKGRPVKTIFNVPFVFKLR